MAKDSWNFPGSRWWKCDLHVHTPASHDFQDTKARSEEWVEAATKAGVEVIAVTDHNTNAWIDPIQNAAHGNDLVVFPAVEMTVNGGIHVLAVLDATKNGAAVASLLGACDVPSATFGKQQAISSRTLVQVAETIDPKHGGICIAAHVDGPDGFLKKLVTVGPDAATSGDVSLQQIVCCQSLLGAEANVGDETLLKYLDNARDGYRRPLGPLPLLEGSDAHALAEIGRRVTWIKMSDPNLEGLRLALLDGEMSVRRGSTVSIDLNARAEDLIEEIEVCNARYLGRPKPFVIRFNPWLNCIIGGHGTGKSTIVEFIRLAMRRENELPESLRDAFSKYGETYSIRDDPGLLTDQTAVRVVIRRGRARYRVQWSKGAELNPIEEYQPDGTWRSAPGDVRSRFPIRIFSQKQIYRLAEDPNALLMIIDQNETIAKASWLSEFDREQKQFLSLRAEKRALEAETLDESRLRGELEDVIRKVAVFEASEHKDSLSRYETCEREERALSSFTTMLEEKASSVENLAKRLSPPTLAEEAFPATGGSNGENEILAAANKAIQEFADVQRSLQELAERARAIVSNFAGSLTSPPWSDHVAEAQRLYREFESALSQAGVRDPSEYRRLIRQREELKAQIDACASKKTEVQEVSEEAERALERLIRSRAELTERRKKFLSTVVGANDRVHIEIVPYGDHRNLEEKMRDAIGASGQTFQDQIWSEDDAKGLLHDLYSERNPAQDPEKFLEGLSALTRRLVAAAHGSDDAELHGKFVTHLRKEPAESLDRLETVFPEDAVRVSYRSRQEQEFRPLDQGSPGQKSAAILAFVLSHGTEPLILDQPEDDLDGSLISDLIVAQLRQTKASRQVIAITHNANIVVNGDAELVIPLGAAAGQTHVDHAGGLQERSVRDQVCNIVEGGRDALERRYRRIKGAAQHV